MPLPNPSATSDREVFGQDSANPALTEDVPEVNQPEAFPEGGWQAWATVMGAALAQFATFGYYNAIGVYQGTIGWIGSIQVSLILSSGVVTGRAFDRGYFYHMMIGGSSLYAVSFFALSISEKNQFYQVILSHGLGAGLATGLMYTPTITIPSHFFQRKRAFAMGVASSGAALGAAIHPIILNKLFYGPIGFHNGVRLSVAINTVLLLISLAIMRTRLPPKKTGNYFPLVKFLSEPSYACVFIAAMMFVTAVNFPIFNIQTNAISHGVDRRLAFCIIPVMNASSFFGRFLLPMLTLRFGVFNLMILSTFAMAVTLWSHLLLKNFNAFIIIAIFFGFFSGAGFTLRAPLATSLAKDSGEYGARVGIMFFGAGIAVLAANPIYGALITRNFYWWRAAVFTGATMTASTAFFAAGRYLVSRKKGIQIL